jgi:hypothetical protein
MEGLLPAIQVETVGVHASHRFSGGSTHTTSGADGWMSGWVDGWVDNWVDGPIGLARP